MNWHVPLSDIDFGPEECSAVLNVIQSRWLTMGSVTQEFEQAFADFVGTKYALAVTNGTAALHMACLAAGLGPGDEAIVPSLTFVATANAIRYTGATPVFVDIISQENLNVSPAAIEHAISERTRAILVVHYGGYPCDMPQITALAQKHNLKVIEDAAHAVGSQLENKMLGTWGDVGCFSFFSNKNMTTGEGGMVVTNDDAIFEKMRLLRSHGMTSLTWDRHKGHAWSYDVVELGYNFRIDEIRAALGSAQLFKLEQNNERRRQLTQIYRQGLWAVSPRLVIPFCDHLGLSAAHLLPVILPPEVNRVQFMEHMKLQGIQTSIHYPPVHKFTSYKAMHMDAAQLPITEDVAAREVTLPLYSRLEESQIELVVQSAQNSLLICTEQPSIY